MNMESIALNNLKMETVIHESTDKYSLFSWLLTFGEAVELLKPEFLRSEFAKYLKNISKIYT